MKAVAFFSCFPLMGILSASIAQPMPAEVKHVMGRYACTSCHAVEVRLIGPSWRELAKQTYTPKQMTALMRKPQPENWPDYPPMEPIPNFTEADAKIIANWLKQLKN
ncbi:MAG: hypothetical protein NZM43_09370 [Saprospiraceae bacterium]|nr:hypothetical protein [Saprospiraceae bacterium]MDW8484524.1 c-type cytochrome [Saprospiraceae bacterium]